MVFLRDGPGEFASDQIMRQIGGEAQIREAIEEMQREDEIGGHAVAVRLDIDRHACRFRQAAPAFDIRNAIFQPIRPHVRLQVDVVGAELGHEIENARKIVDRARITLGLPGEAMILQETRDGSRKNRIDKPHANAIEAGITNHAELLIK